MPEAKGPRPWRRVSSLPAQRCLDELHARNSGAALAPMLRYQLTNLR